MEHNLWVFRVSGNPPVTFQPPGNPVVYHDGVLSVFSLMLTVDERQILQSYLEERGCHVTVRESPRQTKEQYQERQDLLGVGKEEEVYPSAVCPACFWFDPQAESFCGLSAWPLETVNQAQETNTKARDDYALCPVENPDV